MAQDSLTDTYKLLTMILNKLKSSENDLQSFRSGLQKEIAKQINQNINYQKDTKEATNSAINHLEHINKRDEKYDAKLAKVYERLESVIEKRNGQMTTCKLNIKQDIKELKQDFEKDLEKEKEELKQSFGKEMESHEKSTTKTITYMTALCSIITGFVGLAVGHFLK